MRVAIIPARGGSKRIPRKNIRDFHGKPIIAYSIEAALKAFVFEAVWVSTEDPEIAEVAHKHGARVLYRPLELARDEVGTQEVMKHALAAIEAEVACCIYPCAPMLRPATLRHALELLEGHDYIVPVATWLQDPGQFYMGQAEAFRQARPLISPRTGLIQIDARTECDINTESDWARALALYEALEPHEKVIA